MNKKAFTLIEILVAITIIGIISAAVVLSMSGSPDVAKDTKRKADVNVIKNALISYSSENYGQKPESLVPCEINNGCPAGLDSALEPFLKTLPDDPKGTHYTYESDGTECKITAVLSTGSLYRYICSSDQMLTLSPVSGVCGSSDSQSFYSQPTTNLCAVTGSSPTVSGVGPWSWICTGIDTGANASCGAIKKIDGACGAAARTYTYSESSFSGAYCSLGSPSRTGSSFPNPGTSVSWSCSGTNGGNNIGCSAYRSQAPIDGVCGTSSECAAGTPSAYGAVSWTCYGLYGGSPASCSSPLLCIGNHTAMDCAKLGGFSSQDYGYCSLVRERLYPPIEQKGPSGSLTCQGLSNPPPGGWYCWNQNGWWCY